MGASVAQVAIAWVMAQAAIEGVAMVPLIGARRRERLQEALGALALELSRDQLSELEKAIPPDSAAGGRYPEPLLAHLDSERSD